MELYLYRYYYFVCDNYFMSLVFCFFFFDKDIYMIGIVRVYRKGMFKFLKNLKLQCGELLVK